MPNYQNGKIYTIRCYDNVDKIYVGSTTQTLSKRWGQHKKSSVKHPELLLYQTIEEKWNKWYIELFEIYPCNSKMELEKREGEVIRQMGNLNRVIAGRTLQEYYIENKETLLEKKKQYHQDNRDSILEKQKKYYQENRNNLLEKKKQYHQDNKDTILEKKIQYYQDNRDTLLEKQKLYHQDNRDTILEKRKQFQQDNRDTILEKRKQYYQENRDNLLEQKKQYYIKKKQEQQS